MDLGSESGTGRYLVTVTLFNGRKETYRCLTRDAQDEVAMSMVGDEDIIYVDQTIDTRP